MKYVSNNRVTSESGSIDRIIKAILQSTEALPPLISRRLIDGYDL